MTIQAVDGLDVTLDEDHWNAHIVKKHPELAQNLDRVIETLKEPDAVYRSKRDPTTRIYARSYSGIVIGEMPVDAVNLRVVVRDESRFVVTAYFAVAMWRGVGERIWPS